MNVSESMEEATAYLERRGVEPAAKNAELILRHVLGLSRAEIYARSDRQLTSRQDDLLREMLRQRAEGWPLQYLTGETDFMGRTFEVRPGAFIPRPETEVVVARALEVTPEGPARVLDVGTGCGNIAVSVTVTRPEADVTATDISVCALGLCLRNARRHGVEDRLTALKGDLFEAFEGPTAAFDLIVSNPPYVPDLRLDELPFEVRGFEPREALLGGPRGLDVIERIIEGAPAFIKEGGWLVLEVDESHPWEVMDMLGGSWRDKCIFRDLAGRERVVRAAFGGAP